MKIEVLSTGTELLRGRNIDTHLSWMARELGKVGLEIRYHQAVDDNLRRLVDSLKLAAARADAIIMTGGLGPTDDDYTRAAVEKAFHRPLVYRSKLWKTIQNRFRRYRVKMAAANKRQAFVPQGARVLPNPNGTAPGFALREGGVEFMALPGPPKEMVPMFLRHVLPRLRTTRGFDTWEGKAYGIPEANVDTLVGKAVGSRASYGLTVGYGQVSIVVRAEGSRRKKTLSDVSRRIRSGLGDAFMEGELFETVAKQLIGTGTTLALAESCTGGLISHRLTDVPGISRVLLEAAVTYSNASKVRLLGVPETMIRKHGAVSAEVARAMALGAARSTGARIGVAVTGIAGPTGGSKTKPVGLCYVAVDEWVEKKVFRGDRAEVKERASGFAANMLRLRLLREDLRGEGHDRKKMGRRRAR